MHTEQSTIRDNMMRYFATFNARDLNEMDRLVHEMFDDAYTLHNPSFPDPTKGPDRIKKLVRNILEKWTEVQFTIEDMFGEENKLVVRYTGKFSNTTTGEVVEFSNAAIQHYVGNKILEEWE